MSLLGIVRHMEVEKHWFQQVLFAGHPLLP
jgi:hypothetical protein